MDDETTNRQSPDDALEPNSDKDGMFHPKTDEERLDQDYDTPASPPDDIVGKPLPPDNPQSDVRPDETEVYNEGESDAEVDNREEDLSDRPERL